MQVPRLNKRVQTSGRPANAVDPSAPLSAFGGGDASRQAFNAAQNLVAEEAGRVVGEEVQAAKERDALFLEEKRKADEIAIQDFDLAATQAHSDIEAKFKSLKGRDAIKAMDIAEEEWTKRSTELKNSLYSEEQKAGAERIAKARQEMIYKAAQNHAFVETERYDDEQTEKAISTYRHSANYNDPKSIGLSIYQQEMALTRYAARKGMPAEWLQDETARARSKTHANVLEGMLVDRKENQAVAYMEKHRAEILPDDLSIVGRIRRELEQKNAEVDESYRNELYMKVHQAVGHTESDSLLRTIDRDLAEGRIDRGFHNTLRTRLLRVNDDPTIPDEEKSARRTELLNRFREIGGRLNKKKTDPKKPLKEGKKGELQEFRDFVLESAPYISGEDERKFLRYTQKAFDDSQIAKIGIFESLRQRLTFLPGMTAEEEAETLTGAMDKILDPKVSVQEATVAADGLAEQKVVAKNPNRAAYQVGQTITVNGAAYKVTGFDTDGEPLVEPI